MSQMNSQTTLVKQNCGYKLHGTEKVNDQVIVYHIMFVKSPNPCHFMITSMWEAIIKTSKVLKWTRMEQLLMLPKIRSVKESYQCNL